MGFPSTLLSWLGLLWHLLLGRGNAVQGPNAHRRSGWGYPIDKDTLQAKNRCSRLSEAQFRLCWDGFVVIYLEEREGWAGSEWKRSGGVRRGVEHTPAYKKGALWSKDFSCPKQDACTEYWKAVFFQYNQWKLLHRRESFLLLEFHVTNYSIILNW